MLRNGSLRTLWPVLAVVLAAAAFWGIAWRDVDRSVLSRAPILDEAHYLRKAHALAHEAWIPDGPFYMSPLYSYLVAATGSGRELDEHRLRQGAPPRGIRTLQALLWLATAGLLMRIGCVWFGPRWGWLPPLLWLGYRPAAILAGQVLLEVPLTFAATAALTVAAGYVGPRRVVVRTVISVLLVGAAALLRGTGVLLIIPVIWLLARGCGSAAFKRTGIVAVVTLVLCLLPPVIHNSRHAGRLTGPSLNGGVNLYVGNWSQANGFFHAFEGFDVENDPGGADYLSGKTGESVIGLAQADRQWTREAFIVMADDPLRVSGLWVRKVWLHFAAAEIPQISPQGVWSRDVPIYRFLIVPYGLIAALALVGMVLSWRTRRQMRPWIAAVILIVAFQSFFFVVSRYRLILVPVLTLAATAGVLEMWTRRGAGLARGAVLVVAAGLIVYPWGLASTLEMFETSGLDNVAVRWQHVGMAAAATGHQDEADRAFAASEQIYRSSVARDPSRVQAWCGLARVVWLEGDHAGAVTMAQEGLGLVRQPDALREDLIGMLLQDKRGAEAVPYLEAALAASPDDPDLLHNAAVALAGTGRTDAAVEVARRLIAAVPDDPRGYLDLGVVLGRAGLLTEARDAFASGLLRIPGHPDLLANYERAESLLASPAE